MDGISESRLFNAPRTLKKYSTQEAKNILYLLVLTIELLSNDKRHYPLARTYVKSTIKYGDFTKWRATATDLYQVMHILSEGIDLKDSDNQHNQFNMPHLMTYLRNYSQGVDNVVQANREIFALERELDISITNYKSIRRLLVDWEKLTHDEKSLAVTRLLQALRARLPQSDVRNWLERMAKDQKLELKDVHNPEAPNDLIDVEVKEPKKGWSTLKKVALGAGIAVVAGVTAFRNKK